MTTDAPIRVMVVDDHTLIREGAKAFLGSVIDMEHVGGIAATRAIRAAVPTAAVLVVSMLDDDTNVFAALRAGARGYVLKGAAPSELERAIRGVASGEAVFGPGIADRVLHTFTAPPPSPTVPFPELTDREREVLNQLAAGRSNGDIARTFHLSPRTVANHVPSILTKLQATDRTQAALRARDAGLGE